MVKKRKSEQTECTEIFLYEINIKLISVGGGDVAVELKTFLRAPLKCFICLACNLAEYQLFYTEIVVVHHTMFDSDGSGGGSGDGRTIMHVNNSHELFRILKYKMGKQWYKSYFIIIAIHHSPFHPIGKNNLWWLKNIKSTSVFHFSSVWINEFTKEYGAVGKSCDWKFTCTSFGFAQCVFTSRIMND